VLTATAGPVAHAVTPSKSPRVISVGTCGSAATKMKASAEDSGTQVEYELDQNRSGATWQLELTRNGAVVASASRTTKAPSGSLHWRVSPSGASNGTFSVKAKRGSTTCTLSATL
jgi:hypothetical protein